jgi:septal ring factor EnvC (AmiA/AmiB activator)
MERIDHAQRGAPAPPPWRVAGASLAGAIGLVVLAVISGGAQAPDTTRADALARRAATRIKALQREADSLASRERTLLEDLRQLEVERDLRAAELEQGAQTLDRIQAAMAETATRIATLEHAAQSQLPDLSARMVDLYKIGNGGYLRLLLSVDDLRSMGRAYRFVSGLQRFDQQRVREHQRTLADLRKAQASLEERRQQAQAAQVAVADARNAAERAVAAHEDMVRRIDARRDLAAQFMGELHTAQQQLQRTLDDTALGAPLAPDAPLALPLRPFKGDLDWPVPGKVVAFFGRQVDRRFHTSVVSNGVRLAAAAGAPVTAIHGGAVAYAESFPGFGKLVIVDHGAAAFSLYGYLADIDVALGTHVSSGQPVGTVGTALDGTAALYFELRIDGKPVDPLQWLRRK